MRLFHMPGSRSSRALWALEEAGVEYDITFLTREEKLGTRHASRHPLGRVPVLELDGGEMIFESAAIVLHLGDVAPTCGLVPPIGDPRRPQVYAWTVFAMSELEPAAFALRRARRAGSDESDAIARLTPIAAALTAAVSGRPWLVGEEFTAADLMICTILAAVVDPPVAQALPELVAYVERARERPAYVRAEAIGRPG